MFNVTLQCVEMRLGETQEGDGYIKVAGGCASRRLRRGGYMPVLNDWRGNSENADTFDRLESWVICHELAML